MNSTPYCDISTHLVKVNEYELQNNYFEYSSQIFVVILPYVQLRKIYAYKQDQVIGILPCDIIKWPAMPWLSPGYVRS